MYNLYAYIQCTPSYYDNDTMLLILEQIPYTKKRVCSVEDIFRLLLHPSLSSRAQKYHPLCLKERHLLLIWIHCKTWMTYQLMIWMSEKIIGWTLALSRLPWEGAL